MMNYDDYFVKAVLPHVEHSEDLKQCAYVWGKAAWDRALLCDLPATRYKEGLKSVESVPVTAP